MKPYYEHAGISIYHGDCLEMSHVTRWADVLVTDPPYGMNDKTRRGSRRSKQALPHMGSDITQKDWAEIQGDDSSFDPRPWLSVSKVVMFGANHFSSRLPDSRCWLVWDKREGTTPDDNADCEFAWTNLNQPARLLSRLWRGVCRRGEENATELQHPHQKPLGVMQWAIKQCDLDGNEKLLDPFMGSGSTLIAAKRLHISAIGIEIEEKYCEIAAKRLSQEVFQFGETHVKS